MFDDIEFQKGLKEPGATLARRMTVGELQAVIFDIDGTLVDSVDLHAESWRLAFVKYGKDPSFCEVRHQIGKGGDQLMPVFLSPVELKSFGDELEAYRLELFKREFFPKVRAFPCVRELFERIRSDGLRIALASSAKEEELSRYLELLGVSELVETSTSSDDAERSKPHPDIFEAALGRLELGASEAIAVGDTPYDVEAAGKIRLRTIGLLCGGFPAEELKRAGAIALYHDPEDLLRNYDRSPLGNAAV